MKRKLGAMIRTIREDRGISRHMICQEENALTVRQLQRIENGECYPSLPSLIYLAEKLDTTVSFLLDEE
ncbi:helix-turn-helix domain-containing protein [Streptococcus cuniculipharyngis]|uniref:Helix-turn-helix transcriptional regulator n=1 Tax=Streptococcus cuniculipharyngis TaxID=1562651 RepID=A0A5C5SAF1_9STRE|nr:helix-turn-helix transcriptional regulator [Streptococcus cuniculipharyngis]TWS96278.1 helix-turn-helix transcriptional regulator [Streptococcus cuniculipharyngis]